MRDHPESPDFASALGRTYGNMAAIDLGQRQFDQARTKLDQAILLQRKAMAANPAHPSYRYFLTNHLTDLIRAAEGLGRADLAAEVKRQLNELGDSHPQVVALNARLSAVLSGQAPKDNAERIQLAYRANGKALYAFSARLFAEALSSDPKLADDRQGPSRLQRGLCRGASGNRPGQG